MNIFKKSVSKKNNPEKIKPGTIKKTARKILQAKRVKRLKKINFKSVSIEKACKEIRAWGERQMKN